MLGHGCEASPTPLGQRVTTDLVADGSQSPSLMLQCISRQHPQPGPGGLFHSSHCLSQANVEHHSIPAGCAEDQSSLPEPTCAGHHAPLQRPCTRHACGRCGPCSGLHGCRKALPFRNSLGVSSLTCLSWLLRDPHP